MKASGITNSERKGLLVCTIIVSLVFFVIQTCSHRSDPRLSSTPLNAKDTFPVEIQESRAKLTGLARHPEASPASLDVPMILLDGFYFTPTAKEAIGPEVFEELESAADKFRSDIARVELKQFKVVDTKEGEVVRIEPTPALKGLSAEFSRRITDILSEDRFGALLQAMLDQVWKISDQAREISLLSEGEHHYITEQLFDEDNAFTGGSETLIESNKDHAQDLERRYSHLIDFVEVRSRGEGTSLSPAAP